MNITLKESMMTEKEFKNLSVDDTIRNKKSGVIYGISKVIEPGHYFAISETTVKDPDEWILIAQTTGDEKDGIQAKTGHQD